MAMEKIVYYYLKDDGVLYKATLNRDQAYYAVNHCHDFNSLIPFIETVSKWEKAEE